MNSARVTPETSTLKPVNQHHTQPSRDTTRSIPVEAKLISADARQTHSSTSHIPQISQEQARAHNVSSTSHTPETISREQARKRLLDLIGTRAAKERHVPHLPNRARQPVHMPPKLPSLVTMPSSVAPVGNKRKPLHPGKIFPQTKNRQIETKRKTAQPSKEELEANKGKSAKEEAKECEDQHEALANHTNSNPVGKFSSALRISAKSTEQSVQDRHRKQLQQHMSVDQFTVLTVGDNHKNDSTDLHLGGGQAARAMTDDENNKSGFQSRYAVRVAAFLVISYLLVGVAFGALYEGWSVIDSAYWSVVTLSTTGFGDIVPSDDGGKVFVSFYITWGIGLISIALGVVGEYVMDRLESLIEEESANSTAKPEIETTEVQHSGRGTSVRKWMALRCGIELSAMQNRVLFSMLALVVAIMVGTAAFTWLENLSFIDAWYLSMVSLSTVGYGEISPKSPEGRAFSIVWLIMGTLVVARCVGTFVDSFVESRREKVRHLVLTRMMKADGFRAADTDNSGNLSEAEYTLFKLVQLGTVTELEVKQIRSMFRLMDVDGNGSLTIEEIVEREHQQRLTRVVRDNV